MARPNTARGTKVRLLLAEVGATAPYTYTQLCGITARTINFQKNVSESFVPDCDNPDDPAWRDVIANGLFIDVTGEGIMDTIVKDRMWAAWKSADPLAGRLEINVAAAAGGGGWEGSFMVTNITFGGNDNEGLASASISLQSSGEILWVPAT